jgi:hypothetical protein
LKQLLTIRKETKEFFSDHDETTINHIMSDVSLNSAKTVIISTGSLLESLLRPDFVDLVASDQASALQMLRDELSPKFMEMKSDIHGETETLISGLRAEAQRYRNELETERRLRDESDVQLKEMQHSMQSIRDQMKESLKLVNEERNLRELLSAELAQERQERKAETRAFMAAVLNNVSLILFLHNG